MSIYQKPTVAKLWMLIVDWQRRNVWTGGISHQLEISHQDDGSEVTAPEFPFSSHFWDRNVDQKPYICMRVSGQAKSVTN